MHKSFIPKECCYETIDSSKWKPDVIIIAPLVCWGVFLWYVEFYGLEALFFNVW